MRACPLFHIFHALFDDQVALLGHTGHHDALEGISLIFFVFGLNAVAELNLALGVGKAGGSADDDRRVEFLADLIGIFHEILGFLGIRGLKAGNHSCAADAAGVLFVLGAVETGVIGDDKDKTAVRSDIGDRVDRICSHVQADHLHAGQGTDACEGSADGDFRGNLLIGSPLSVYAGVFDKFLTDLRAGSSGICGGNLHTGFPRAAREGGIAQHHLFFTHKKLLVNIIYSKQWGHALSVSPVSILIIPDNHNSR